MVGLSTRLRGSPPAGRGWRAIVLAIACACVWAGVMEGPEVWVPCIGAAGLGGGVVMCELRALGRGGGGWGWGGGGGGCGVGGGLERGVGEGW